MKVILRKAGLGKTTELIKESAEMGYHIVCVERQKRDIIQLATDMNVQIPEPITHYDFIWNEYYGKDIKGFLIDNVDLLLNYLTHIPIKTITITDETE